MAKLTQEQSKKEVEKWLSRKRISKAFRETKEFDMVFNQLAEAFEDGILILKDDFSITHALMTPITGDVATTSVSYKGRLTVGEMQKAVSGIEAKDQDARMLGIVSELTGLAKGIIKAMDLEDYGISQSIAVFFIK